MFSIFFDIQVSSKRNYINVIVVFVNYFHCDQLGLSMDSLLFRYPQMIWALWILAFIMLNSNRYAPKILFSRIYVFCVSFQHLPFILVIAIVILHSYFRVVVLAPIHFILVVAIN